METLRPFASSLASIQRRIQHILWLPLASELALFYGLDTLKYVFFANFSKIQMLVSSWASITIIAVCTTYVISIFLKRFVGLVLEQEAERHMAAQAANQLEVVQSTARAVAHNLNQPFTAIIGYAQQLLEESPNTRHTDDLTQIIVSAERAALYVRQLQAVEYYNTIPSGNGQPMLDIEGQNIREDLYQ